MKQLWLNTPENTQNFDEIVKIASQTCHAILVESCVSKEAKKTGLLAVGKSNLSDILLLETFNEESLLKLKAMGKPVAVQIPINSREDELDIKKAVSLSADFIIIDCPDWKVIPIETVIAVAQGKSSLLAKVTSHEEAKLAVEALEIGADGVVLETSDPEELLKTATVLRDEPLKIELVSAEFEGMRLLGTGARACIDTCELMQVGEGILCGCQSQGLFLIEAEVHSNPFVETRPFRVNAGAISLYTLAASNQTRYLSEFKVGDAILVVARMGWARPTNIGRVKIEWRPLVLVEAKYQGKKLHTIIQNAETIRMLTADGSKAVGKLKTGDLLRVHVKEGGRHFGVPVPNERVIEQ
jgi:3-dehydroquinate synthase II